MSSKIESRLGEDAERIRQGYRYQGWSVDGSMARSPSVVIASWTELRAPDICICGPIDTCSRCGLAGFPPRRSSGPCLSRSMLTYTH